MADCRVDSVVGLANEHDLLVGLSGGFFVRYLSSYLIVVAKV